MALMICPECGGQVSDKAHTCPHCGYPIEELMAQGPAIPEVCLYEYKGQTYDVTDIVRTLLSGDRGEAAGILWELLDLKREEVTMVLSGIENQFAIRNSEPAAPARGAGASVFFRCGKFSTLPNVSGGKAHCAFPPFVLC